MNMGKTKTHPPHTRPMEPLLLKPILMAIDLSCFAQARRRPIRKVRLLLRIPKIRG